MQTSQSTTKQPPENFSHKSRQKKVPSMQIKIIGILQLATGGLTIIFNIVAIGVDANLSTASIGIWGGCLFIAAGITAMIVSCSKTNFMISLCGILSVVSSLVAFILLIVSAIGAAMDILVNSTCSTSQCQRTTPIAANIILIILAIVELFVSLWQTFLCFLIVCCLPASTASFRKLKPHNGSPNQNFSKPNREKNTLQPPVPSNKPYSIANNNQLNKVQSINKNNQLDKEQSLNKNFKNFAHDPNFEQPAYQNAAAVRLAQDLYLNRNTDTSLSNKSVKYQAQIPSEPQQSKDSYNLATRSSKNNPMDASSDVVKTDKDISSSKERIHQLPNQNETNQPLKKLSDETNHMKPSNETSQPPRQSSSEISQPPKQPSNETSQPPKQPFIESSQPTRQPFNKTNQSPRQPSNETSQSPRQPSSETNQPSRQPFNETSQPLKQPSNETSLPPGQPSNEIIQPPNQPSKLQPAKSPSQQPSETS